MKAPTIATGFITGFGSSILGSGLPRLYDLTSLACEEAATIWRVEEELQKLRRTFLRIQYLIDKVGANKLMFQANGYNAWKTWHENMKNLSYDADALVDRVSFATSTSNARFVLNGVTEKGEEGEASKIQKVKKGEERKNIIISGKFSLPRSVKKMQAKLDNLAKEMESLLLIDKIESTSTECKIDESPSSSGVSTTSLLADEGVVIGRKRDKVALMEVLNDDKDKVSVISLVGMGGIGKTTLARLVYNDHDVYTKYRFRIWVSVSIDLDVTKITKSMVESITKKSCISSDLNLLQQELRGILARSGKFLLVLDGYWSENNEKWEILFAPLRQGAKGSKILITTRSTRVSTICGSLKPYYLSGLSDPDCWTLMKGALPNKVEGIFEEWGSEIAKKCGGLPLAAKTIGNALKHLSTRDEWQRCSSKSELWEFPEYQNEVVPSLMLSYIYLPSHLRKCFIYCSIFPRNYKFDIQELVLLWMAEDFIKQVGKQKLEEIGIGYFKDLCSRSFFQLNSDNATYKMPDLIHNLAQVVSGNTCVQVNNDNYSLFGDACHLSLQHDNIRELNLKASSKNKRLRTLLVICKNGSARGLIDANYCFSKLKYVRVMGLSNVGLKEVPDSIKKLIYIRYLNLSGNPLERLPESICKLLALQTLKLLNNSVLTELPLDIKELSELRHLEFDDVLQYLPAEFGKLTKLQTLSAYVVGDGEGQGIEQLENMNSLRGSLSVKNIEKISMEEHAKQAQLEKKTLLNKLELYWEDVGDFSDRDERIQQQVVVFSKLKPHVNLESLTIKNYSGLSYPKWLGEPEYKFTKIHLQGLDNCTFLPSFGKLPLLKSLFIENMPMLKSIGQELYGDEQEISFPLLESLEVHQMINLIQWSEPTNNSNSMKRLTSFRLDDCPNLTRLPVKLRWMMQGQPMRA